MSAQRRPWWAIIDLQTQAGKNVVLFCGGLLGVIHETFFTSGDRQYLLVMFGIMMGIPAYMHSKGASNVDRGNRDSPDATGGSSAQETVG